MSTLTNLEQNVSVIDTLFSSLAVGDLETFARLFAPNVVWHQPGNNKFSGDKPNFGAIGEMVNGMMSDSQGSFCVKPIGKAMANNDLVSVPSAIWRSKRHQRRTARIRDARPRFISPKRGQDCRSVAFFLRPRRGRPFLGEIKTSARTTRCAPLFIHH